MKTVFACMYMDKNIQVDDFEKGCVGKTTCIMAEPVRLDADTLPKLLEKIQAKYGLKFDSLWIGPILENEDGGNTKIHFSYSRPENEDGEVPTDKQKLWENRRLKRFLADYNFYIEKRVVSAITADEFKAACTEIKVETHD